MTRIACAVAAAFLLLPAFSIGAAGEETLTPDDHKIAACLKEAASKGVAGTVCIGIVADPCIAEVRDTNEEAREAAICAAREVGVWQLRLNNAGMRAAKAGGKELSATLATSMRHWGESATSLCPLFQRLGPGMALGGGNYCYVYENAIRALQLERLADALHPH